MIKKIMAIALSAVLMSGLAVAQEKTTKTDTKMKNPIVEIQTNHGSIYVEIFENETPIHAKNFLSKVDGGKYNGLTFHRVAFTQDGTPFVIQGGDPRGDGRGSMPGPALADEKSPFPEARGTIAMARSDSASNCQFYINMKDNTFLDKMKFSAFGRVVQGMDVADKIAQVKRDSGDKPIEPVVISKMVRVEKIPVPKTENKAPESK